MNGEKMIYDPSAQHGRSAVLCSAEGCDWGWTRTDDLNDARVYWELHVAQTHTFEAEMQAARQETEALRVETERLREQLRRAGLPS